MTARVQLKNLVVSLKGLDAKTNWLVVTASPKVTDSDFDFDFGIGRAVMDNGSHGVSPPLNLRTETDCFRKVMFFCILEYWTMDKVQELSNSRVLWVTKFWSPVIHLFRKYYDIRRKKSRNRRCLSIEQSFWESGLSTTTKILPKGTEVTNFIVWHEICKHWKRTML
jgi:hypothetical protein